MGVNTLFSVNFTLQTEVVRRCPHHFFLSTDLKWLNSSVPYSGEESMVRKAAATFCVE